MASPTRKKSNVSRRMRRKPREPKPEAKLKLYIFGVTTIVPIRTLRDEYFRFVLEFHKYDLHETSKALGVTYRTVFNFMKDNDITIPSQ